MSGVAQKRSRKGYVLFILVGLIALTMAAVYYLLKTPQRVITLTLRKAGMDQQTIRFWIAVSAFETAGWTSRVFNDSNNLFNLVVPRSNKLPYGEGQTIYNSIEESAQALVDHVIKPFSYSLNYATIADLCHAMKLKNYYGSSEDSYTAGVRKWYQKLNGESHL